MKRRACGHCGGWGGGGVVCLNKNSGRKGKGGGCHNQGEGAGWGGAHGATCLRTGGIFKCAWGAGPGGWARDIFARLTVMECGGGGGGGG